jgi:hypothetical protein
VSLTTNENKFTDPGYGAEWSLEILLDRSGAADKVDQVDTGEHDVGVFTEGALAWWMAWWSTAARKSNPNKSSQYTTCPRSLSGACAKIARPAIV